MKAFFHHITSHITVSFLRKYFLMTLLLLGMFAGLYMVSNKFIYTFGFTDEGDNISIGKFLLQDKKLYKDVFSQHQPLTYYVSSVIQTAAPADNVLLVVRRHRQFILFFSFIWIAFLTYRFGYRLVPFLFIIELLKYYYLGHLFLAESLVIYPLAYLFCLWWETTRRKSMSSFDAVAASLAAFFVVFNLVPTIVGVGLLLLALLVIVRKKRQLQLLLVIPGLIATGVLFIFVPIRSYIETTVWANFAYYIPKSTLYAFKVETGMGDSFLQSFLWPISYLTQANTNIFIFIQILLILLWISLICVYVSVTKRIVMIVLSYLILVVLNTRPPIESMIYFHAFHSLPFFAVFVISLGMLWQEIHAHVLPLRAKLVYMLPLLLLFGIFLLNPGMYYRETISARDTPYIQFSHIYMYSDAVRSLARSDDTFAVYPYEELLYWYSGIYPPSRFLFYQSWVYDVPEYKAEITEALTNRPPAFVYAPATRLIPYLQDTDYTSIPLHEASSSALFIRNDRLLQVTDAQWDDIKRHGFRKPGEATSP